MAKKPNRDPFAIDEDENAIPANFPDNVSPSEENVKAFKAQAEADRKAVEDGSAPDLTEERVGEGVREIPVDEREPEASAPQKSQVRQNKTVSK
jgi:hypothetical protein